MKKTVILLALLFFLFPISVSAEEKEVLFAVDGNGRYIIRTARDLARVQAQATLFAETGGVDGSLEYLAADYVLAADIDLDGDWIPIGFSDANPRFAFSGSFDGAGFTINGLKIDGRGVTFGLFGKLDGAEIRNIVLNGARISAIGDYGRSEFSVGILAGEAHGGVLENIRVYNGEISAQAPDNGNGTSGSLIGKANGTQILNCKAVYNSINADSALSLRSVGGIAGFLNNCEVRNTSVLNAEIAANAYACAGAFGQISGGEFTASNAEIVYVRAADSAGGFAGLVRGDAVFRGCRAVADVSGGGLCGGFVGEISGADVLSDGFNGAGFNGCRAFGRVESKKTAGGFTGLLAGRSRISDSHAFGTVIAEHAGGFAGEIKNSSRIEFSTANAAVFGRTVSGGFAGTVSSAGAPNTITGSVALGPAVIGTSRENTRRFAGQLYHDGINGCYSYLGMAVIVSGVLQNVLPNPYGGDGGDARFKSTP